MPAVAEMVDMLGFYLAVVKVAMWAALMAVQKVYLKVGQKAVSRVFWRVDRWV